MSNLEKLLVQMEEEVAKDVTTITDEDCLNQADYVTAHEEEFADILADLGL